MSDGDERERLIQLFAALNYMDPCDETVVPPDEWEAARAALSAARESALREAAEAVHALEAPSETTDSSIGELRGLCRAEIAIRALLEPPPPPKGTNHGEK